MCRKVTRAGESCHPRGHKRRTVCVTNLRAGNRQRISGDGAFVPASRSASLHRRSLGALVGADLLNLNRVQGLSDPVVSIGGAGTFDGVFLTGILAVLLAGL
jgi:hypothetical protein